MHGRRRFGRGPPNEPWRLRGVSDESVMEQPAAERAPTTPGEPPSADGTPPPRTAPWIGDAPVVAPRPEEGADLIRTRCVCGSRNATVLGRKDRRVVGRCEDCGTIRTLERP